MNTIFKQQARAAVSLADKEKRNGHFKFAPSPSLFFFLEESSWPSSLPALETKWRHPSLESTQQLIVGCLCRLTIQVILDTAVLQVLPLAQFDEPLFVNNASSLWFYLAGGDPNQSGPILQLQPRAAQPTGRLWCATQQITRGEEHIIGISLSSNCTWLECC